MRGVASEGIEECADGLIPGGRSGVRGAEPDRMLNQREEAFIVGRVAEADGDGRWREAGFQEPGHTGVFAGVCERMVEAASAGEGEAAGGECCPERVFALRGEEDEGLAVLALGGEGGAFRGQADAGGDLIQRHIEEGVDGGLGFGGGIAEGGQDFGARAAEDVGGAGLEDDRAAVFDNTGVGEPHSGVPEFDFGARLGGSEDDRGADRPEALERGQGGLEGVRVVIEEAIVEVSKDDEHDSTMAGLVEGARC